MNGPTHSTTSLIMRIVETNIVHIFSSGLLSLSMVVLSLQCQNTEILHTPRPKFSNSSVPNAQRHVSLVSSLSFGPSEALSPVDS